MGLAVQMKAGKYVHLLVIDDVEKTKRKSSQDSPPQIAVNPLIEGRIKAKMAFDSL